MDSLAGMDRLPYEPGGYEEIQQENLAAPENAGGEDFFADAPTLEYSPFDEGEEEGQGEYSDDTDLMEEEYLPVDPARIPDEFLVKDETQPDEETGQQYAEESDTENLEEEEPEEEMTGEEEFHADGGSEGKSSGEESAEEDRKRAEHEASEAKRKAEWEARQQAKKEAEKAQLERIMAMCSEELAAESMKRVSTDTEKLVRRNMKECVSEYVQTMCLEDEGFARQVMLPQKNMIRCFQYINRKAYEYVQDEMKAAGVQPGRDTPCYSSDIPEDVCYHWAEEYFRTMDVKEDKEEEEKFVPKPYVGKTVSASKEKKTGTKKSPAKKPAEKKTAEKKTENKKTADDGQMSFAGQISFEDIMALERKAG